MPRESSAAATTVCVLESPRLLKRLRGACRVDLRRNYANPTKTDEDTTAQNGASILASCTLYIYILYSQGHSDGLLHATQREE